MTWDNPPLLDRSLARGSRMPGSRSLWRARYAYFFVIPFLIPFLVFDLWPLVRAVMISFYDEKLVSETFIGLDNYGRLLNDPIFWKSLYNTGVLTVFTVPIAMALSLVIAISIFRLAPRLVSFTRAAFYLPVVASSVVMSIIWLNLLNPFRGLLNQVVQAFGFPPVLWLGTDQMALNSVGIVLLSFGLGGPIILFMAGLGAIPEEVVEAARIDGASTWQEVRHITLPLLRPSLLFVLITLTIGVSQTFAVVQLLTLGGPVNSTQTIVFRIYDLSFNQYNFGYASAYAVILLILVPIIAFAQYKLAGKEVVY